MNVFDHIPDREPVTLTAGDFWTWRRPDLAQAYPPAAYALSYALAPVAGGPVIPLAAPVDVDGAYTVATAVTAGYAAGDWSWTAFVTRIADGARTTVSAGTLRIVADAATTTADRRTDAAKALAAIEAVLAGRADRDDESYTIGGRSLSRTPVADLLRLRAHYADRVAGERDGKGGGGFHKKRVRFT